MTCCLLVSVRIIRAEMEKVGDTGDISLLIFSVRAMITSQHQWGQYDSDRHQLDEHWCYEHQFYEHHICSTCANSECLSQHHCRQYNVDHLISTGASYESQFDQLQ